ncbi:MAG: hypothetical protein EON58_20320 [Alphaproteobacteria bacterium]|nr:MAG: hypothetical protein EON58_20320 [Alphaproteobacteria bacterium]
MVNLGALALLAFSALSQDVSTSGRDPVATQQWTTVSGLCGSKSVEIKISDQTETVIAMIGDRRRDISDDLFPLGTAAGSRRIARTHLICRPSGRVSVSFVFASTSTEEPRWAVRGFSLDQSINVLNIGEEVPLAEDDARRLLR